MRESIWKYYSLGECVEELAFKLMLAFFFFFFLSLVWVWIFFTFLTTFDI